MGHIYAGEYAAYDDRLDRRVALKLITGRLDAARRRQRVLREAKALARLSHPNVVRVHEVGEHEGLLFIAMEYVFGETLDRWLARAGPLPWRDIVTVYLDAGRGLAAAHRAGLVHRDFKPANVMLLVPARGGDQRSEAERRVVKVLDFGLARFEAAPEADRAGTDAPDHASTRERDHAPRLTREGALIGTPAYMSPEQFRGCPATDRSDQYSFFSRGHAKLLT